MTTQDMARDMLLNPNVQATLDLDREPSKVRDRYGEHICGQSVLLARRPQRLSEPVADSAGGAASADKQEAGR